MSKYKKGLLLAFLGVVFMSFESPAISFVNVSGFDYVFFFGLFLFISSFSISLFTLKPSGVRTAFKANLKGNLLAGIFMALSNISFTFAVKYAGIALPVIILATSPIFCAIFDRLFFKNHTPKSIFISTFFVIIGIIITVYDRLDYSGLLGILLSFLCVFCFSMLYVILGNFPKAHRGICISLGGFIIFLLSMFFVTFDITLKEIFIIGIIGLFITPASRYMLGYSTLYILPAQVGLINILESILAPFWGYVFLNQNVSINLIVGGVLILIIIAINTIFFSKS